MRRMMLRSVNQNAFSNPLFRFKENGITIEYTGNVAGDTGILFATGETYTAVDETMLRAMNIVTDDYTKVVTTMVTDIDQLFNISDFNQNINSWDVSNVTSMRRLFFRANKFNQSLFAWDVSNVTNMELMFRNNTVFNQDISNWNTSGATNMNSMFQNASVFNQDLSGWCVSQFATEPTVFSTDATAWVLPKPNWGAPC